MQKATKDLLQGKIIWVAIIVTISIVYLSLIPTQNFPQVKFNYLDKVYHIVAYFTLSFSWFLSLKNKNKKNIFLVIVFCILYGTIIEVLQDVLTSYRTADYRDIIANSIGVLLGLLIFNIFSVKK